MKRERKSAFIKDDITGNVEFVYCDKEPKKTHLSDQVLSLLETYGLRFG